MNQNRLEHRLTKDEGLRLKPYHCSAGKLTIGIGRNIEERGISQAEALFLLRNDIETCESELRANFTFFEELSDIRQEVLLNMCFNLGISRLKQFKKMIQALDQEDYARAAREMLDSRWANQVGKRAVQLAHEMKTGKP